MNSCEAKSSMNETSPAIYAFSALSLEGQEVPMAQFEGKVLLIVNTASKCGFTPQYAGLESLYLQYKNRGLMVLGFPCNQFGAQEPGSEPEIARFCESKYSVSFSIFSKIDVNGANTHPLYRYLKRERAGLWGFLGIGAISWNFTKFLVSREGAVVARFAPSTSPADLALPIEKLL